MKLAPFGRMERSLKERGITRFGVIPVEREYMG